MIPKNTSNKLVESGPTYWPVVLPVHLKGGVEAARGLRVSDVGLVIDG